MRNNKRGQGLPINVIIIAALALIVLVVIAAVFTGRFKIFSESLDSCSTKQGECKKGCEPNVEAVIRSAKCPETPKEKEDGKNTCCIRVLNK